MSKSGILVVLAACSLCVAGWCGLFLNGTPTVISPFPLLTSLPVLAWPNGRSAYLVVLCPAVLFLLWNPRLASGPAEIPRRSSAALAVLSFLTVFWFAFGWGDGLLYQGATFTRRICVVNALWLVLLWLLLVRGWRTPRFSYNMLLHWLLFMWLGWFAFPYLGELP